ncbi:Arc family DNA-binding protein [Gemmobacter sp. LW-1]|uniref:Arc family DNA-binding protein n=1 Tax=Gemmobacter sp. LW-1 TaxID=1529005 RepID=UPI0009EA4CE1|nr:Arc family DNA-binding protein [Gemmobacter sp. LW-1]
MNQTDTIMRIRLPAELKAQIAAEAAKNLRSLNAEVVFVLRAAMARDDLQPTT